VVTSTSSTNNLFHYPCTVRELFVLRVFFTQNNVLDWWLISLVRVVRLMVLVGSNLKLKIRNRFYARSSLRWLLLLAVPTLILTHLSPNVVGGVAL